MDENKRLGQASCWEGLAVSRTWSSSGGQGQAQQTLNLVFFWCGGCSAFLQVALRRPVLESAGFVIRLMVTSSKRTYANTPPSRPLLPEPLTPQQASVNPHLHRRLPVTQASLAQSPMRSLLLSLWSGTHKALLVPSKSLHFPCICVHTANSLYCTTL